MKIVTLYILCLCVAVVFSAGCNMHAPFATVDMALRCLTDKNYCHFYCSTQTTAGTDSRTNCETACDRMQEMLRQMQTTVPPVVGK